MATAGTVFLIVISILLIVIILLQQGRSAGLSGAITGGAEQLFGKQKARGIEAVMQRITAVLATLFFIVAFLVAYFL
ncbi:preprotein translocase subunit SecG [Massilibacterium senegalense]|uniref:preprotein translocase subunit SecG n=1 Tax=Massilibacterium senegalense TaxID=1632858 RepID=UPI000B09A495|nr:preprotein translocase subunit SecG [Massilibacterium senegalense]